TWMYSKGAEGIYVNLFAGSAVTVEGVAGTDVELVQTTDYPWSGRVAIAVNPKTPKPFTMRLRSPNRDVSQLYTTTPAVNGHTAIKVNGARVNARVENGYAVIARSWKKGDTIELELPMQPQRVRATDKIAATKDKVALRYGPLVYNIEQVDQDIHGVLDPGAPLTTEFKKDLLGGVTVIRTKFADGTPVMAIPNFVHYNRNPPDPPRPAPPPAEPGQPAPRPAPPPATSIVWIKER